MNSKDWIKEITQKVELAERYGHTSDEIDDLANRAGSDLATRLHTYTDGNPALAMSILMSLCQFIILQGSENDQRWTGMMMLVSTFKIIFEADDIQLIADALMEKADRIDGIWRRGAKAETAKMLRIMAMTITPAERETC